MVTELKRKVNSLFLTKKVVKVMIRLYGGFMVKVRTALIQINTTVGDLKGNIDKIITYLQKIKQFKINLAVFPELTITGYPPEDLLFRPGFISNATKSVDSILPHTKDMTVIIGSIFEEQGLYNTATIINNGKISGIYRKHHLPNYGVFDEKRYFKQGKNFLLLKFEDSYAGITVCEDMWIDNGPVKKLKEMGAGLVLNLSASPYHFGKIDSRKHLITKRASENNIAVAFVNLVGGQDELVFDGGSIVASSDGSILAEGKYFDEDIIICNIEVPTGKKQIYPSANIEIVDCSSSLAITSEEFPSEDNHHNPVLSEEDEIYQALVLGLKDYVKKNGFNKVVLGLSGGIDSALTAVIAVDALGCENVSAITMPGPYSSQGSIDDSVELAENLAMTLHNIPISDIYNNYIKSLKSVFRGEKANIAEENIQARIRGNILMAFSNKFNSMVIATGNKSEMAVGYCTIYGDMAGGFAVLKDIYKTTVYKLSQYVNSKGKIRIPLSTISKAPSAELRPDQKDEDSLPPYPVLDQILKLLIEDDLSVNQIISSGQDRQTVQKIATMVYGNEYKRRQGPPGVKITPRAFGKDRRFPITNKYRN